MGAADTPTRDPAGPAQPEGIAGDPSTLDPPFVETGLWWSVKGEPPLPSDVHAVITVTVMSDGTIGCQTRSADGRSLTDVVADVERARNRLTDQIEQRFKRCPMFKLANDRSAA